MDQDIDEILEINSPSDQAKSKDEVREANEQELQYCPACKRQLEVSNDLWCGKCKKIVWSNMRVELYGSLGVIAVGVGLRFTDSDALNDIATLLLLGGIFLGWRAMKILMSSKTRM